MPGKVELWRGIVRSDEVMILLLTVNTQTQSTGGHLSSGRTVAETALRP